jgi:methionyl aminopeptidase
VFTRVKTPREIDDMRESGQMLAAVLKKIKADVQPGMSGKDVSRLCTAELRAMNTKAAFYGYNGYPDVICISVNDVIVHGIPNDTPFKEGDLVSFDFGVSHNGMITDSAFSMVIGTSTKTQQKLLKTTERSMYAGIEQIKNGVKVGDIAAAVQGVLEPAGFGIVRDLVGHGVGHAVHEDPNIPNYGVRGTGTALKSGMTIAIEPMATIGDYHIKMDRDGWTIRTIDGSLAAHFEHTVLITDDGYEILTAW